MDLAAQLSEAMSLLNKLAAEVRSDRLSGAGGGLCRLKGRWVFFFDQDADVATQLDRALAALLDLPEAERHFMSPALRERVEEMRAEKGLPDTNP
jgi:hypothetical protein